MATLKPPFWAESMEGLYKKVTKGIFERITGRYSKELSTIIKLMLQVNPNNWADCNSLLNQSNFMDRLDEKFKL